MAEEQTRNPWEQMARDAYDVSTGYLDTSYRRKWEDSLRHFSNRHAAGSKYYKDTYKYRSKTFMPKTRSSIRGNEAAAVAAFFANEDVVSVDPRNPLDPEQKAAAAVMAELLNYRLTETIPWFLICIGAFQTAQVMGAVASYNYWKYRERETRELKPAVDPLTGGLAVDEDGRPMFEEVRGAQVLEDRPCIELLPLENLRFHPSADWLDPIGSSPYVIRMAPMYAMDVKTRMKQADSKTGQARWREYSDGEIRSAVKPAWDSTRMEREGQNREDKYEDQTTRALSDYDIVWCHENFFRVGEEEFVFWTLGPDKLLTDPSPIEEVYFHGRRPITLGIGIIEAMKVFPDSLVEIGRPVQQEINETTNQRRDNVKLVLNKRFYVKNGAQLDLRSLTRNVPGSVTLVNDVNDVRTEEFHDITGSSYQEEDRLNLSFDELVGAFGPSTVQSNRKIGETVGGMAMMRGSSNQLVEYLIRTFSETWVEPTLKQLTALEQAYESDEVVLALAAERAQIGVDVVTDRLLNQTLTTKVSVGMGATDPIMKMQNFMAGIAAIGQAFQTLPPDKIDQLEVAKEVFARLGYKDGKRFFVQQDQNQGQGQTDPQKEQMMQMLEQANALVGQLQQQLNDKNADRQTRLAEVQIRETGQDRRTAAQIEGQLIQKRMDLLNPVSGEAMPYAQ